MAVPPSEAEGRVDRDHRGAAGVGGVDDLGAVDALQVVRGDPEVGVAELALDDDQRDTFTGHLDGMCVAKLMWREPTAHACSSRGLTQLGSARRPATTRARASVRWRCTGPVVHPDLAGSTSSPGSLCASSCGCE